MNEHDLLDAIGDVNDEYIRESGKRPKKQKSHVPQVLAAVLALAVLGSGAKIAMNSRGSGNAVSSEAAAAADSSEYPLDYYTDDGPIDEDLAGAPDNNAPILGEAADAEDTAPAAYDSVAALCLAAYPESVAVDDYEAASQVWTENQVSDATHAALKNLSCSLASRLLANSSESGCISPLSIYQCLAVAASGSDGETRTQMLNLLGADSLDTLADQAGKLYRVNYKDNDSFKNVIANSVWLDDTDASGAAISYNQDWVISASDNYYADVYAADFSDPSAGTALGSWIAEKTGGFLTPSADELGISEDTLMTILNTVWYKASWNNQFNESETTQDEFETADGIVTADFMHKTLGDNAYYLGDGYTLSSLELQYGHMTFVLPDEDTDLDALLTEEKLSEILNVSCSDWGQVIWSIPKFETSATYSLADSLQSLGMTDAFEEDTADFSLISDTPLYLSKMQQGIHIAVAEDGVEAAAYTAAMFESAGAPDEDPTVIEMNLNRPFLYFITANDGSIEFIGTVRTV